MNDWESKRHTLSLGKPDQNALALLEGWHALLKSPCATECVGESKWNSIWSPTAAVSEFGEKLRPLCPTATVCTPAAAEAVEVPALLLLDLDPEPP